MHVLCLNHDFVSGIRLQISKQMRLNVILVFGRGLLRNAGRHEQLVIPIGIRPIGLGHPPGPEGGRRGWRGRGAQPQQKIVPGSVVMDVAAAVHVVRYWTVLQSDIGKRLQRTSFAFP